MFNIFLISTCKSKYFVVILILFNYLTMYTRFDSPEFCKLIKTFHNVFYKYYQIVKQPKNFGTGEQLHHAEIHTIVAIGENPEINITELARETAVSKGAVSQTVQKLEEKQLIARYKGKDDREVHLRLSDKGVIAFEGYNKLVESHFRNYEEMFKRSNETERNIVFKVVEAINNQFDEYLLNNN